MKFILASNGIFYKKTSAPFRKHNLLETYVGYSLAKCADSCNRLSCNYFTTANYPDKTRECKLYGFVEMIDTDHGDVMVYIMNFGKQKFFILTLLYPQNLIII